MTIPTGYCLGKRRGSPESIEALQGALDFPKGEILLPVPFVFLSEVRPSRSQSGTRMGPEFRRSETERKLTNQQSVG